ncbi:MAG: TetR/AcrR family transcriptional regulator [Erysipelotrichia bacterium]|nr:TetR/AcrR family transcriptional regulator [Erysipelotrichia bacterium]
MALLIEKKKAEKRKRLLDAAYACFIEEGVSGASIARICDRADIAKGTFYLYFRDKDDLEKALNLRLSYGLLEDASQWMEQNRSDSFTENCILMADRIISRFEHDSDLLTLLRREFTWPASGDDILFSDDSLLLSLRTSVELHAKKTNQTMNHLVNQLFALTGMVAAASYSSIVDHYPCPMSELRPILFDIIRRTLNS